MRIRTIKPEFFTHDGLFEAEKESGLPLRVAFPGLWCMADREGRFKWEPRRLGIAILPYDGIEFSRVLDALVTRGFLVKYSVAGVWYGCIPSFSRHQVINNRERESELPDLIGAEEVTTREPRVSHASGTPLCKVEEEGKGREQGKEGKEKDKSATPPVDIFDGMPEVLNTKEFRKTWLDYVCYRISAKLKPLKSNSVKAQWQEMEVWGEDRAIQAIMETIRQGWQGIFEPKARQTSGKAAPKVEHPKPLPRPEVDPQKWEEFLLKEYPPHVGKVIPQKASEIMFNEFLEFSK